MKVEINKTGLTKYSLHTIYKSKQLFVNYIHLNIYSTSIKVSLQIYLRKNTRILFKYPPFVCEQSFHNNESSLRLTNCVLISILSCRDPGTLNSFVSD